LKRCQNSRYIAGIGSFGELVIRWLSKVGSLFPLYFFVNILAQRARLWVTPGRGKSALPPEGARKVVPMFFIYRTDLSVLGVALSIPDTLHIFGS
jgi:hypothetical protein